IVLDRNAPIGSHLYLLAWPRLAPLCLPRWCSMLRTDEATGASAPLSKVTTTMRGFERGWWIERPRKRRLAGCRPRIEPLEERALAANLPLVVVPGQPGSFPILNRGDPAGAVADMQSFLLSEGQGPGSLTWDFAIH